VEPDPDLRFEALTPLSFSVHVTRERWKLRSDPEVLLVEFSIPQSESLRVALDTMPV
jgi:hypothetical protein